MRGCRARRGHARRARRGERGRCEPRVSRRRAVRKEGARHLRRDLRCGLHAVSTPHHTTPHTLRVASAPDGAPRAPGQLAVLTPEMMRRGRTPTALSRRPARRVHAACAALWAHRLPPHVGRPPHACRTCINPSCGEMGKARKQKGREVYEWRPAAQAPSPAAAAALTSSTTAEDVAAGAGARPLGLSAPVRVHAACMLARTDVEREASAGGRRALQRAERPRLARRRVI